MNQRNFCGGGGLYKHKIFDETISLENLFLAWKEFRRGKRKKPEVQQFEFNLEDNIFQLHNDLKSGEYQPRPYSSFYVCDPKRRHIHKADIRDRVLYQAVFRILYPIFDKGFIYDSYSSRINKGTHAAVNRLSAFLRKISQNNRKNVFALKCDISKFFDSIDHDILTALIKRKISDENCFGLIEKIIKSFEKEPGKGLPLGNVTSQLFANIYLNELDQFIKHKLKIKFYLRYCDDFVILDKSREYLDGLINETSGFLDENLKLKLHPRKIIICKYHQGVDFLGYVTRPYHRILRMRTKKRMFRRISKNNAPSYLGILKHSDGYKVERKIRMLNF